VAAFELALVELEQALAQTLSVQSSGLEPQQVYLLPE
jgi:hypothetical protein